MLVDVEVLVGVDVLAGFDEVLDEELDELGVSGVTSGPVEL